MDKIDKLKALIELSQNDTITPKQVEKFLTTVLDFIRKAKDNFETLSKENLQTIQEAIVFIEQKKDKLVIELDKTIENKKKDVNDKIVSDITDVKGQFTISLTEAKKLLKEIKAIKVIVPKDGVDGKDGIDGVNPDPSEIVPLVLEKIPKVELDTAEEIANKLETLEGDNRLDAKALKNLPEWNGLPNGGGWRNLFQLHDVNINSPTNGQVLKYNSINNLWENATDGGGNQTPWLSDIDADGYGIENFGGFWNSSVSNRAILDMESLSSDCTYTFPNNNGTFALTSDLALYVPYTGATSGVNLAANNMDFLSGSAVTWADGTADEVYITGLSTGLLNIASSFTGKEARLDISNITTPKQFAFPDNSGTLALTSDITTGISRIITNLSTGFSVTAGSTVLVDYVYLCSGSGTITMPVSTGTSNTNRYTIKNVDGSGTVTVLPDGAETIDGGASLVLLTGNLSSIDLVSDNSGNWCVV